MWHTRGREYPHITELSIRKISIVQNGISAKNCRIRLGLEDSEKYAPCKIRVAKIGAGKIWEKIVLIDHSPDHDTLKHVFVWVKGFEAAVSAFIIGEFGSLQIST